MGGGGGGVVVVGICPMSRCTRCVAIPIVTQTGEKQRGELSLR